MEPTLSNAMADSSRAQPQLPELIQSNEAVLPEGQFSDRALAVTSRIALAAGDRSSGLHHERIVDEEALRVGH
jgi:hypothetical protein